MYFCSVYASHEQEQPPFPTRPSNVPVAPHMHAPALRLSQTRGASVVEVAALFRVTGGIT